MSQMRVSRHRMAPLAVGRYWGGSFVTDVVQVVPVVFGCQLYLCGCKYAITAAVIQVDMTSVGVASATGTLVDSWQTRTAPCCAPCGPLVVEGEENMKRLVCFGSQSGQSCSYRCSTQ